MFFVVEDDGTLALGYATDLKNDVVNNASRLIAKYIDKYPNPLFRSLLIQ